MAYLYVNDGLIVLTQPEKIKSEFDVLTCLFDRVGLRMNTKKMVSMSFQPCYDPGQMSSEAYKRRTTRTGPTFQYQQRRKVYFPDCGLEVASGLLLTHLQSQNGVGQGGWGGDTPLPHPPWEAQTYRVSLPKRILRLWCLVEGCICNWMTVVEPTVDGLEGLDLLIG